MARGDTGGGWEAPGHVKSGFIFPILLDFRYCCQTMSLIAREPTHFIFHFEKAGRDQGKNLDVHC